MSDVTREEFDALKARCEEIAALVATNQGTVSGKTASGESVSGSSPMWHCKEMASASGTFAAGTDWTPQFEQNITYMYFGIPTVHGEINCLHPDTSHGRAARCELEFYNNSYRTVNYRVGADNMGRVQMKINSETLTEITSDTNSTLQLRPGKNVIVLMTNGGVDRMDFKAGLF